MRLARISRTIPAIGLGLALTSISPTTATAQGLSPSSGSGAGTGTGMSSGSPGSTGTGRESGSGLGTTGPVAKASVPVLCPEPFPAQGLTTPGVRRPIGRPLTPAPSGMSTVSPDLFLDARSVADPGERALALVRIAQTAIFSKQLNEAHTALFEAGPAALAEPNGLIREQRLTAIVEALLSLAEERMSDTGDLDLGGLDELDAPKAPPMPARRRRPAPRSRPSPSQPPPAPRRRRPKRSRPSRCPSPTG